VTGSEQAVERLLSEAHAAAGPSAEQRLNALGRLEEGLGAPASLLHGGARSAGASRTSSSAARPRAGVASSTGGSSNHWLAACALLGAIGALGAFSVGRGTAAARLLPSNPSTAAASSTAVRSSAAASSIDTSRARPSGAPLHSASEPLRALELLQSAQRSLLDSAPAHALTRLDELEAFGADHLVEEREATRVLAWCARGERARALEVASALRVSHPGSLYERRLSETCVGGERRVQEASSSARN
jgi:hypothetical protein